MDPDPKTDPDPAKKGWIHGSRSSKLQIESMFNLTENFASLLLVDREIFLVKQLGKIPGQAVLWKQHFCSSSASTNICSNMAAPKQFYYLDVLTA